MIDKELRKLNRRDLLEILVVQAKEIEALSEQVKELEKQLESKRILIENAGSIAEAALKLNGVFEAAQAASEQYIENIRQLERRKAAAVSKAERKTEDIGSQHKKIAGNRPERTK